MGVRRKPVTFGWAKADRVKSKVVRIADARTNPSGAKSTLSRVVNTTELEADTEKILRKLRKFLTKNYGKRCEDFDRDCPCCRVWVRYDLLEEELG